MKVHHYELQNFMMSDQILNMSDHFKNIRTLIFVLVFENISVSTGRTQMWSDMIARDLSGI